MSTTCTNHYITPPPFSPHAAPAWCALGGITFVITLQHLSAQRLALCRVAWDAAISQTSPCNGTTKASWANGCAAVEEKPSCDKTSLYGSRSLKDVASYNATAVVEEEHIRIRVHARGTVKHAKRRRRLWAALGGIPPPSSACLSSSFSSYRL